MEKSSKVTLSLGWAAAFTWFGGHCGSGFASGRQIVQYTTRHGFAGIWIPMLTWTVLGWFTYWAVEYSRAIRAKNYRDFTISFYGKAIGTVLAFILDIITPIGSLIILSAMFSASAELAVTALGMNYTVASFAMAIICCVCTVFFYKAFSYLSSFLTIPMIVLLLVVQVIITAFNWDNLMLVIQTSGMAEGTSVWAMIQDAFTYAGVQCAFYATIIALAYSGGKKWTKKDTKQAVIGGSVLNWAMHTFNVIMVYSGYPRVNDIPLVTNHLVSELGPNWSWLLIIYQVVLLLAIITTAIGSVYGFLVRFGDWGGKIVRNQTARYMIWGLIVSVGSVALAAFGLIAIINKGYGLLGGLRAPTTIYPIAILGVWRFNWLKKKIAAGEDMAVNPPIEELEAAQGNA